MEYQDYIETDDYSLTLDFSHINESGTGIIVITYCGEGALEDALDAAMEKMQEAGARNVLAVNHSEDDPFIGDIVFVGKYLARQYYSLDTYGCKLGIWNGQIEGCPLVMEPLSEDNIDEFIELNNKAMSEERPLYYNRELAQQLLDPASESEGFVFRANGKAVAMGEQFMDMEPQITALAVDAAERRKGYGKWAAKMMLADLEDRGAEVAYMTIKSINEAGLGLLYKLGFETAGNYITFYTIE